MLLLRVHLEAEPFPDPEHVPDPKLHITRGWSSATLIPVHDTVVLYIVIYLTVKQSRVSYSQTIHGGHVYSIST